MKVMVRVAGPTVERGPVEIEIEGRIIPLLRAMESGKADSEVERVARETGVSQADIEPTVEQCWRRLCPPGTYQPISARALSTHLARSVGRDAELVTRSSHRIVIEWPAE